MEQAPISLPSVMPASRGLISRRRVLSTLPASILGALALGLLSAGPAAAVDIGQISKLQDFSFSNLDPMVTVSSSQNLCVYSSGLPPLYNVVATGSGAGQAFTLQAGSGIPDLPYSLMWAASAGQTSGTAVSPGQTLPNNPSGAISLLCTLGLATSASLIVTLSSSDLQSAVSGVNYQGQLSLTITAL